MTLLLIAKRVKVASRDPMCLLTGRGLFGILSGSWNPQWFAAPTERGAQGLAAQGTDSPSDV
jgi:hypothetical protein